MIERIEWPEGGAPTGSIWAEEGLCPLRDKKNLLFSRKNAGFFWHLIAKTIYTVYLWLETGEGLNRHPSGMKM